MEVYGKIPDDDAERSLYDFCNEINAAGTAWFNLDIPAINEIDALCWFKDYGFFIIETKGFRINDFKSVNLDYVEYRSVNHQNKFGKKPPPWKQAKNAARILSTYLSDIYYRKNIFPEKKTDSIKKYVPFTFSLTYFPFISELEFKTAFPDCSSALLDYLLFNDCHSKDEYLSDKLKKVVYSHVVIKLAKTDADDIEKNIRKLTSTYSEQTIEIYKNKIFLSTEELNAKEPYDRRIIDLIETKDVQDELRDINFDYPVLRTGYAGTGKTIIALAVLNKFASEDRQVLFTCYNKVLATDLKRFTKLSFENHYKYLANILISDIHALIQEYAPTEKAIDIFSSAENTDDKFNRIVDQIIESGYFKGAFDYIVIDEAQDLKDYGWKLLLYLSSRQLNSLIVLNGKEQNLYTTNPSKYLLQFEDVCKRNSKDLGIKGNIKQKRRIYRNRTRTFLFSQSFLEFYPEESNTIQFIKKNEKRTDLTFEFARDPGNFPYLFVKEKDSKLYKKFVKAIKYCLEQNKDFGLGASSILIIVPYKYNPKNRENNHYRNIAIRALNEIKQDFIDYTIDENRRLDYRLNQVRIVSYHSSRGLESNFSIVLGFEELKRLSDNSNCDYHKLGYIILSRAKYETYIFIDNDKSEGFSKTFVDYTDSIYKEIEPETKFIYKYSK
jgi:superfamily I DNA and RNA helicase